MSLRRTPVVLVLMANDRFGTSGGALDLSAERDAIEAALKVARHDGRIELVVETELTIDRYSNHLTTFGARIVGIHFAGHANASNVVLETATGSAEAFNVEGLAQTLGELPALRWVFLNGCGTHPQAAAVHRVRPVPVVATHGAIRDQLAVEFADHFYRALGNDRTLGSAFRHAEGIMRRRTDDARVDAATTLSRLLRPVHTADTRWPWALCLPEGVDDAGYALPSARAREHAAGAGGPDTRLRLEIAEPPGSPTEPYPPVLGAYTDRRLFAGRDREVAELRRFLDRAPVVCMWARSGAGKSSLIAAGLVPALRDAHIPEAVSQAPHEAGTPAHLLRGILEPAPEQPDPRAFVEALTRAHTLAGAPPVLVLDQFEELFKSADAAAARARLGPFLAATVRSGPTLADRVDRPLCRWVLAYRHEFHGEVRLWLRDVLAEAREADTDVDGLPHDLTIEGRSIEWPLPLFGAPDPGQAPAEAARLAFRAAITKPLQVVEPPWSINEADADRLASAFATARLRDGDQPLVPELQVVLARLVRRAMEAGHRRLIIAPEDDLDMEIARALRTHTLRSIERVLPVGRPGIKRRRALLLTALLRLVDDAGRRSRRLPPSALLPVFSAIDPNDDGAALLDALIGPGVRLLTVETHEEHGPCLALAHDQLADVVAALVKEAPHGTFDSATLDLIDFVRRRVELHDHGDPAALAPDDARFDRLEAAPDLRREPALAAWWDAWETVIGKQRRAERAKARRKWWAFGLIVAALCATMGLMSLIWIQSGWLARESLERELDAPRIRDEVRRELRAEVRREGHLAALSAPNEAMVLNGLAGLVSSPGTAAKAIARLPTHPRVDLWTMMAETFVDSDPRKDAALRLAWAESRADRARIEAETSSTIERIERIGKLLAAVDSARGFAAAERVQEAREAVIRALYDSFPLPAGATPAELRGPTLEVLSGVSKRGSPTDEAGRKEDERRVAIEDYHFAIGTTEVTVGAFRRLVPEHRPGDDDDLPARGISWYAATAYAAWVGARLPTEAEWEYAARDQGRQPAAWCSGHDPRALDAIAWFSDNSRGQPKPVGQKEPCGGLYDMHGNVWEWVADWYDSQAQSPLGHSATGHLGPPEHTVRVLRGGAWLSRRRWCRSAYRYKRSPGVRDIDVGFRIAHYP